MLLFIIFFGLLLGLGVVYGLSRFRPEYAEIGAAVTLALTFLIWLVGRAALPLEATISRWPAAAQLPPLAWLVDETGWALTAWLLLLALATLLVQVAGGAWQTEEVQRPASLLPYFAILFVLGGMVAIWPDSLAGMLAGWLLLNVTWMAGLLLTRNSGHDLDRPVMGLGVLFLSLLFLWLGASGAPDGLAGWHFSEWPAWTVAALIAAGLLQIGLFPLYVWRLNYGKVPAEWLALLCTTPAVAGIGLLARLEVGDWATAGYRLPITIVGFVGVLAGLILAWRGEALTHGRTGAEDEERTAEAVTTNLSWVVGGLAVAQASLVGLAGVWAGAAAVLSEGRVLLLAIPVLFLMEYRPAGRRPWLAAGPAVAVLALAGLPLTAGFAGRAALYNRWLVEGQFVLVLVAALLHVPLIAVLARLLGNWLYPVGDAAAGVDSRAIDGTQAWRPLLTGGALLLAALGLLTVNGVAGGDIRLVSWLAVLLPVAAGVWLARSMTMIRQRWQGGKEVIETLGSYPGTDGGGNSRRIIEGLRELSRGIGATIREAAHILEGEGGLLWLLLLVVVFWLARRG